MVDLVVELVWYRLRESAVSWYETLYGAYSSVVDPEWFWDEARMDPLGLLLLAWILLAGVVYFAIDHIQAIFAALFGQPEVLPARNPALPYQPLPSSASFNGPRNLNEGTSNEVLTKENRFFTPVASFAAAPTGAAIDGSANNQPSETLQARVKLINYSQEGSDWVNAVLNWLYHRYNTTPEFADIWLSALNEYAKRNAQQMGLLVTFDRFLVGSCAPRIGDVRAELSAEEQLSIFCSVEIVHLGFHALSTVTSERGVVSTEDYDVEIEHVPEEVRFLNINDMRQVQTMQPELTGDTPNNRCFILRLLIHPSPQNDLIMTAEFEKNPRDLLVNFPSSPVAFTTPSTENDQALLRDAIKKCIQNAVTTIKLARFRDFPFPPWLRPPSKPSSPTASSTPSQTQFTFSTIADPNVSTPSVPFGSGDHQVIVKVIRADDLGNNGSSGVEPYCVIEMDEPPQKHTSSVVKNNGAHPAWEETFLFDISGDSSEILFELYDRTKPQRRNFLGTAIVSLHELSKNPSQRQAIALQSRPLMDDSVSGTITLEFTVLSGGKPLSTQALDLTSQLRQSSPANGPARNSHVYVNSNAPTTETLTQTSNTKTPSIQKSYSEEIPRGYATLPSMGKQKASKRKLSVTDGNLSDAETAKGVRSKSSDRKSSFLGRMKRRFSFGKRTKSLEPEVAKEEFSSVVTKWERGKNDRMTDPMDSDQEVLLAVDLENSRSRRKDRSSRSNNKRSKSAPGSREPSASRSTGSNKAGQLSWKKRLRSRFSKHKDHDGATVGPTVVQQSQEF
ncbi:hypothetical protein RvY_01594-2 [Ramazzottius varieornatus]|uniref:C2 domain-containing protein n=1 Tax=Ramazzottius varieornatus TaxID=947166 RepID=A0A1D1UMW8_RAMVA|nr:hypothetical protein RvY_01594-2 [Ramazzottius varieornatus]